MLKLIFSAFVLIQLAQSYEVTNNKNCAKGPEYWCANIQNSKECNAFKHCVQTVWTKHAKYFKTESNIQLSAPSQCSNCINCFVTDLRRCPVVRDFKSEIAELLTYDMPARSICELIEQCEVSVQDEGENNEEASSVDTNSKKDEISNGIELDESSLVDNRFECGLHPRNWCNSIESAQRCNSVDNCLFSWSKSGIKYRAKPIEESTLTIEQLNSQKTCGFCIFIFNKLQSVIQQNSTEVNVQNYLTSACALLPSKEESDKCIEAVTKYLPEIYAMVRNNVDPGIICRVLKACSDKFLEPFTPEKLTKPTEELENESKDLKNKLSQLKIKVLNEDEAIIKTPLQKVFDAEPVFHKLGSKTETLIPKLAKSNGVACELCTIVLTATRYLLENKVEEEKILGFIQTQLCERLGSLSGTCKDYIKEEGAEILELISKSVDPALLCRGMGLCVKSQVSDQFENNKFFDLNARNPLNCTLCKMVIEQVKKMMSENKSQAEIIDYINNNLCEKVGKTKELCKSLIDAYGPLFIEIIAKDIHPDQICSMIGMCNKQMEDDEEVAIMGNLVALEDSSKVDEVNADATCILCEFVLNLVAKYVAKNSTEPEIEKWLDYVCDNAMPVSLKNECNAFVTTYGPIIINLLTKQISADKVCQTIGLCNKNKINDESNQKIIESNVVFKDDEEIFIKKSHKASDSSSQQNTDSETSIPCTVCQFSIQYIDSQIQVDRTEKAIKFAIANVCKFTPRTYRPHCDSLVSKYGVKLITFIDTHTEPVHVCSSIKICKIPESLIENIENPISANTKPIESNKPSDQMSPIEEFINKEKISPFDGHKITAKNGSLECSLCIYVAQIVDNLLKQNKTDQQILEELKLVCRFFPNNLQDQCNSFMNEYGPYVLQLIASELDPETACAALRLCEKAIVKERLRASIIRYNLRP